MRPDLHPFLVGRLGTMPSNALGPLLAGGRFLLAKTGKRLGSGQTERSICLNNHQRHGLGRTKRISRIKRTASLS